eukprot:389304_1
MSNNNIEQNNKRNEPHISHITMTHIDTDTNTNNNHQQAPLPHAHANAYPPNIPPTNNHSSLHSTKTQHTTHPRYRQPHPRSRTKTQHTTHPRYRQPHPRSRSRSRSRSRDRTRDVSNQNVSRSQQRDLLKQSELHNTSQTDAFDIQTQAKAIGLDYFTLRQIAMTDEQIMKLIRAKQKEQKKQTKEVIVVNTYNAPPQPQYLPAQTHAKQEIQVTQPPIQATQSVNPYLQEDAMDHQIPKLKPQSSPNTAANKQNDTGNIIMPKSHSMNINNADKDVLGATELAGKNNDKIPLPSNAKEEFSVFVGDLHHLVTRKDLLSVFGKVGDVVWIQLFDCHAQLNRPFNFAFIYYSNIDDATKCIDQLNFTKFYGNPCRVMLKSKNQLEWTNCNLIVKNLPPNTNSQILYTLFEPYGTITSSKVKTTNTGRTLPYGYVQFNSYEAAQKALNAAQNKEIKLGDNVISAEWFRARDNRPNKQIFIKNIPAEWDEKKIIEFVQEHTKFNIASISTKGSPYGKWACVAFYELQQANMAIRAMDGIATGDYIHPKLSVSKFMNKSDRDRNFGDRHQGHNQHQHHHREHRDHGHHRDHRDRRNNHRDSYHGSGQYHRGHVNRQSHNNNYANNNHNYGANQRGNMNWNGGFNPNVRQQSRGVVNYGNRNYNNYNGNAPGNGNPVRGTMGGSAFGMFSLYVGNIPQAITESHLQQIFESFGKIRTCHILEKTVDFRYGFVNFAYAEDAARALVSMNGKKVGDKCLQVKPTQKDGDKAKQIEYFACVMHQNQTQFTGNNVNQYGGNTGGNVAHYQQRSAAIPYVPPAHVTAQPLPPQQQQQPQPQIRYDGRGAAGGGARYDPGVVERVNPAALAIDEAERILCADQHVIVWKVQYGEEWHEYNTQLAALTEQLQIGCKTTITLSDSDYLLTKIDEKQALQQNLTTGTTRKVVRLFRSKR